MTLSYGSGLPPFIRNEEEEDLVQQVIYNNARPDEDDDGEDLTTQFLNDSGEGLESEERTANEVPLTNSGTVYIMA